MIGSEKILHLAKSEFNISVAVTPPERSDSPMTIGTNGSSSIAFNSGAEYLCVRNITYEELHQLSSMLIEAARIMNTNEQEAEGKKDD